MFLLPFAAACMACSSDEAIMSTDTHENALRLAFKVIQHLSLSHSEWRARKSVKATVAGRHSSHSSHPTDHYDNIKMDSLCRNPD
jgi:hypothetical protein